jgi:low density lipoprotein receptor-related protein 5/6
MIKLYFIVPEAFLLFSRLSSLRRISIDTSNGDKPIPIPGIVDANAVDFHINQSRVFWTGLDTMKINRAFINGSQAEVVIGIDVGFPDGLAVDWVADNLYWTDTGTQRIECSRLDGRHRKILIWKNMSQPHSLTLDPGKG